MTNLDDAQLTATINAVRHQAPLVHCISAAVTAPLVADGLLAAGARPMMTETTMEAPSMVVHADALLINLGTLSMSAMESISPVVAMARKKKIPWVLDPAAIGVAPVRTALAKSLLKRRPQVVRGNVSEVLVLAGGPSTGRGPDAAAEPQDVTGAAHQVSAITGGVVAVSGAIDLITDLNRQQRIARGDPMLTRVTGTGCLLGALTAACLAVSDDPFNAAGAATTWLDIAGELAAARTQRPGSFRTALLDALDEVGR